MERHQDHHRLLEAGLDAEYHRRAQGQQEAVRQARDLEVGLEVAQEAVVPRLAKSAQEQKTSSSEF